MGQIHRVCPDTDLVYTIGVSDYSKDWFFAQVPRKKDRNKYQGITWQIQFKLDDVDHNGPYKLRLALAYATLAELQVRVNNPKRSAQEILSRIESGDKIGKQVRRLKSCIEGTQSSTAKCEYKVRKGPDFKDGWGHFEFKEQKSLVGVCCVIVKVESGLDANEIREGLTLKGDASVYLNF